MSVAARRFVGARSGSATVELALILPVAISILGLVVFGGEGMSIKRKVTLATRDVGDLVAQTALAASANTSGVATIDATTLNYYLSLSSLIVYPYDPTQLAFEVSGFWSAHRVRPRLSCGAKAMTAGRRAPATPPLPCRRMSPGPPHHRHSAI